MNHDSQNTEPKPESSPGAFEETFFEVALGCLGIPLMIVGLILFNAILFVALPFLAVAVVLAAIVWVFFFSDASRKNS